MKEIEQIEREYTSVRAALPTLELKPTDPDASLTVGKFRCFIKGDWNDGLAMLALSNDTTLKNLAVKELSGIADAGEQLAIADQWWDLSEKETGIAGQELQRHAAEWYQKAWPTLTGLARAKVQSRLKVIPLKLNNPVLVLTFERETFAETKEGVLVKDLSPNQNNGLVFGASPIKGKVGAALSFDGSDDYVLLEQIHSESGEDSAELTIAMWLLFRDLQKLRFAFDAGSPTIRLFYESGPNPRIALVTPDVDVRAPANFAGEWHHFVGTRDASTQRLYLDGELIGEQRGKFLAIPNTAFGSGPARIGSQVGGCLGPRPYRENRCFNGAIDEFLILQHALTPFEVAQLYQVGLDGTNLNRIEKPAAH